ncbi:hypothetical protein [Bradyrhizobium japonicum]|uniref:hypothetical protein n=2 Tax=Bradyrhizobium TaxID=374 RepID=UPI0004AEB788|nr:hypothetical protein [Bradyrhizobium japonicum]
MRSPQENHAIIAAVTPELFQTGMKKGRGMARTSLDLIDAMRDIAEEVRPVTGRGIGYKRFTRRLITSMSTNNMQKVYRLLRVAREQGTIPWDWIVDETRELERVSAWSDPAEYARSVACSYRRDVWDQQPCRVEVWSEKGTVRGVLKPVLDQYVVGFRVQHGFSSATAVHDVAADTDGRDLVVLYVGDYDPSGMYMSEHDLPQRLREYGGDHVRFRRIALTDEHVQGLPSFAADDKKKDPRHSWFKHHHGTECWELDAMDPRDLRDCVESAIVELIEPAAWERCEVVNAAERESLRDILVMWKSPN